MKEAGQVNGSYGLVGGGRAIHISRARACRGQVLESAAAVVGSEGARLCPRNIGSIGCRTAAGVAKRSMPRAAEMQRRGAAKRFVNATRLVTLSSGSARARALKSF